MPSHHDDKVKILKNQEIDISLFPTTHQIVPTFFPNEQFGQNNETGIHGKDSEIIVQYPLNQI